MTEKIILLGGGGHCKVVIDAISSNGNFDIVGILDRADRINTRVCGVPVIGTDDDLSTWFNKGIKNCFIAVGSIGNARVRTMLTTRVHQCGFWLPNIIHRNAYVSPHAEVGYGNFVAAAAVINPGTVIANMVIVNTGSIVDHDCTLEDFVHIAPGCALSGGVKIGAASHIGTGTSVIQGIEIGCNTLIGAGSTVIHNIGDGVVAFGSPCEEIRRRDEQ